MAQAQPKPTRAVEREIANEAEAAAAIIEIRKLMTQLCEVVEEETALVRAGRLTAAAKVASTNCAIT